MPRRSIKAMCKICGGVAKTTKYYSKGRSGKVYRYEKFVHSNGVVHYFRIGKSDTKMTVSDAFDQMIEAKMGNESYRFGDLKRMFVEFYGSNVSNNTINRNILKSIKLNLIERKTGKGLIVYSKKSLKEIERQLIVTHASVSYQITDTMAHLTIFLHFQNLSNKRLAKIPVSIPKAVNDSIRELDLKIFDQISEIPSIGTNITYSYPGQSGITVDLNRPLRPSEDSFICLRSRFENGEDHLKLVLPLDMSHLRIYVKLKSSMQASIRKRLLDGVKEITPEMIRRTPLENGETLTEAEFENALKGEAIFVSW